MHEHNYAHTMYSHLLVVHVIIGCLSICHDLPEEYTKTPDITANCKFSSKDSLWSSPSDRDFPTLSNKSIYMQVKHTPLRTLSYP